MATSEAQKRATKKYLSGLVQIRFRVKPEKAEEIDARAKQRGLSRTAYIMQLINADLEAAKSDS